MPKKNIGKSAKKSAKVTASGKKFVTVSNKSYGNALKGMRIYYEGTRPSNLGEDGRISFGKHMLEHLRKKFAAKFRWILTPSIDSITISYGVARVRTSKAFMARLNGESYERTRDIKNDIVSRRLASAFPSHFTSANTSVYVPNTLAKVVSKDIVSKLSSQDRDAINAFLPDYLASESAKSVSALKASAEIESLRGLADSFETAMGQQKSEAWWQSFIKANILLIQQGYIKAIEKMNTAIGNTKFPDFLLVTHDNYLDILEIKKPSTELLKHDASRNNYFWDSEVSKAVVQVENYISNITLHADNVRTYILDTYKIDLKIVRPRGIILVGDAGTLTSQKQRDDLRLLSQGLKNINIVTYDELLTRLRNYIEVLEEASASVAS